MQRQIFDSLTEAEWLALRAEDLTSTEVSAVFGVSPYETVFELWNRKAGRVESGFVASDRTEAGRFLEPAIASLIAHREDLTVEPMNSYTRLTGWRMGSSFDYSIAAGSTGIPADFAGLGDGILEIKNVDYGMFKEGWDPYGEDLQAPIHIELQLQYQLLISGRAWGAIGVLVGGNDPRITYRAADSTVAAKLTAGVADFWAAVDEGREPSPDYARDGEVLRRLFTRPDPRLALRDEQLEPAMDAVSAYLAARESEGAAGKAKETAAAHIMHLMRETEEAALPDGSRITWRADKRGRRTLRVTAGKEAAPVALAAE